MSIIFKGKKGAGTITVESGHAIVGTRSGCHLVLDDPMVADRHLSVIEEDGSYFVQDLSSSSGTYLDGISADEQLRIPLDREATIVLGVSRLLTKYDEESGELTLTLKEQSFFYDKKNDPLKWSRSEVELGRLPYLRIAGFAALAAGLLLLLLSTIDKVEQPLVDPGPLAAFHEVAHWKEHRPELMQAVLAGGRDPTDCNACHGDASSNLEDQCATCHEDIYDSGRHPFGFEELGCQPCHIDHRGPRAEDLTQMVASDACDDCHDADRALVASKPATPPSQDEWVETLYTGFPHSSHVTEAAIAKGVTCVSCHTKRDEPQVASIVNGHPRREFVAPTTYESCEECHRTDGVATTTWDLQWHGSDATSEEPSKCLQCHDVTNKAELRKVMRPTPDARALVATAYDLQARAHLPEIEAHRDIGEDSCHTCHRDEKPLGGALTGRPFMHGTHLSSVQPVDAQLQAINGECQECHTEVIDGKSSQHLAANGHGGAEGNCAMCHDNGEIHQNRTTFAASQLHAVNDFPHDKHMDLTKPSLEKGCFSCHVVDPDFHSQAVPTITAEARSCVPCHSGHENVAGSSCAPCHPEGDPSFRGEAIKREWPSPSTFSHFSRGHAPNTDAGRCNVCHIGLEESTNLLNLPIPLESDDSCRKCHIEQRARFHFR